MANINLSVTARTFNKEGQTFLIELRNWIWSQFSSFTAGGVCYIPFLSQITFAFFILFHVNITFCERSQKGVNLDKFEIGVKELPSAGGKPNL